MTEAIASNSANTERVSDWPILRLRHLKWRWKVYTHTCTAFTEIDLEDSHGRLRPRSITDEFRVVGSILSREIWDICISGGRGSFREDRRAQTAALSSSVTRILESRCTGANERDLSSIFESPFMQPCRVKFTYASARTKDSFDIGNKRSQHRTSLSRSEIATIAKRFFLFANPTTASVSSFFSLMKKEKRNRWHKLTAYTAACQEYLSSASVKQYVTVGKRNLSSINCSKLLTAGKKGAPSASMIFFVRHRAFWSIRYNKRSWSLRGDLDLQRREDPTERSVYVSIRTKHRKLNVWKERNAITRPCISAIATKKEEYIRAIQRVCIYARWHIAQVEIIGRVQSGQILFCSSEGSKPEG